MPARVQLTSLSKIMATTTQTLTAALCFLQLSAKKQNWWGFISSSPGQIFYSKTFTHSRLHLSEASESLASLNGRLLSRTWPLQWLLWGRACFWFFLGIVAVVQLHPFDTTWPVEKRTWTLVNHRLCHHPGINLGVLHQAQVFNAMLAGICDIADEILLRSASSHQTAVTGALANQHWVSKANLTK